MLSKKLVGTLGVLTATVLTSPAVADATPSRSSMEAGRRVVLAGTQVGSEGVRPRGLTDEITGVPMLALDARGRRTAERPPRRVRARGDALPRLVYRDAVTVGADGNGVATARFGVFPRQNLRYALEVESGCPEPEGIPSQCPPPVSALDVSINGDTVFAADGTFERDRVAIPVEALSLEDNEIVIIAGGSPRSAARIRILAMPENGRHRSGHRESRS